MYGTSRKKHIDFIRPGIDGKKVYYLEIPAPPIIEMAWDTVVLYTENYEKFCDTFLGAYLEKRVTLPGWRWPDKYKKFAKRFDGAAILT